MLEPVGGNSDDADSYVRQCAFSEDASIIITVDDSANVVQYDKVDEDQSYGVGAQNG